MNHAGSLNRGRRIPVRKYLCDRKRVPGYCESYTSGILTRTRRTASTGRVVCLAISSYDAEPSRGTADQKSKRFMIRRTVASAINYYHRPSRPISVSFRHWQVRLLFLVPDVSSLEGLAGRTGTYGMGKGEHAPGRPPGQEPHVRQRVQQLLPRLEYIWGELAVAGRPIYLKRRLGDAARV